MRNLVKTLTLIGTVAAAGAAHADTEVITNSFDYAWTLNPPFTTSFTLVPDNSAIPPTPDFQSYFDTSLGTLDSVTVQWTNLNLSMQGFGVPQKSVIGGIPVTAPAVLGGAAIAQTQVNGYDMGVLGVAGGVVGSHAGWIHFSALGNTVTATFDAAHNPNNIFTDTANGNTLDVMWNTGVIATLPQTTLPTSVSGLVLYGIQPQALQSPSAKLSGDVVVTYDYSEVAPAPEPSTWALMLAGFAGVGFAGWRASRKSLAPAA